MYSLLFWIQTLKFQLLILGAFRFKDNLVKIIRVKDSEEKYLEKSHSIFVGLEYPPTTLKQNNPPTSGPSLSFSPLSSTLSLYTVSLSHPWGPKSRSCRTRHQRRRPDSTVASPTSSTTALTQSSLAATTTTAAAWSPPEPQTTTLSLPPPQPPLNSSWLVTAITTLTPPLLTTATESRSRSIWHQRSQIQIFHALKSDLKSDFPCFQINCHLSLSIASAIVVVSSFAPPSSPSPPPSSSLFVTTSDNSSTSSPRSSSLRACLSPQPLMNLSDLSEYSDHGGTVSFSMFASILWYVYHVVLIGGSWIC